MSKEKVSLEDVFLEMTEKGGDRLLRLMRNEYQKIFSKISTWVLIVLGLLLIVGIHLLFRSNGTNMDIQYSQFSKESIQQQKQYYRSQTSLIIKLSWIYMILLKKMICIQQKSSN